MPRRNGAHRMATEAGSQMAAGARDYWQHGRRMLHDFDERVEETVREQPLVSIFAAVGVGIAIGIALTLACPASFPQLKNR